jgi:hypothetical protein
MFVYSLVEFPVMMAGGDARAQRVVVVRNCHNPKAKGTRARVNLPGRKRGGQMAIEEAFIMQRARQLYWQGYPPAEIAPDGYQSEHVTHGKSVMNGTTRRRSSASRRPLTHD